MKDKKDYILSKSDMTRKATPKELIGSVAPKRRAIMTSDDDEDFIAKYYKGRSDAFRALIREDKLKKGWL